MTNTGQAVINMEENSSAGYPLLIDNPISTKPLPIDAIFNNDQTDKRPKAALEGILKNSTNSAATTVRDVVVDDPTKKKPTEGSVSPPTASKTKATSTPVTWVLVTTLVFHAILTIISILELIIGWTYSDSCPLNWRIPHYLVVAGVIGIIIHVLFIVYCLLTLLGLMKFDISRPAGLAVCCGVCSMLVVLVILCIFYLGWFIAGCIWVFSAWDKVQYIDEDKNNYCHPKLYRFAFWLLLISILNQVFTCFRGCIVSRKQLKNKKNGGAIPVPTSEP